MSTTEGGSRRGNNQNERGAGQQRQTQNASNRDGNNAQIRKGAKGGSQTSQDTQIKTSNASTPTSYSNQDEHIPIKGFNSVEVENLLQKAIDPKTIVYKPEGQSQQAKSQSPWGTKRAMANGKDFFLELRKQVTALQQSGGVSQGG